MRIKLVIKLSIVSTLAMAAGPATADHHSWNGYHFATMEHPIRLQVVDSVTSSWQFELETSIYEWNVSSKFDMSITSANDSKKTRKRCKMSSGKMRVCNAAYGFNGWLGMATINITNGEHITQGTAKVNDSYSSYWANPNEKRHVMCQEIGHVFGLGHTSTDRSSQKTCMDYSSDPESISPNPGDYAMLADIYNHSDSFNSWADGSTEDSGGCNAPPGKGCNKFGAGAESGPPLGVPVHMGKDHEIWVASDGRGGYWIHFIRLVPEAFRDPSLHR